MKFSFYSALGLSCTWLLMSCGNTKNAAQSNATPKSKVLEYVNPFVGTDAHGHTYPGATVPFGMVQLSPDTRLEGWDGCGGYHYSDSMIYGFSHTHLQGTGVPDYCDILFQPTNGKTKREFEWRDAYKSRFTHNSEKASPGYYQVKLEDYNIKVECTATERTGIHRYEMSGKDSCFLFIDLMHRDDLLYYDIQTSGDTAIYGYRVSRGWAEEQHVYFFAVFNKPFYGFDQLDKNYMITNPDTGEPQEVIEEIQCFRAGFASPGKLMVKVGISAVDVEGAKKNLQSEAKHWDFEQYVDHAERKWENQLSKVAEPAMKENYKGIYYTALYHCSTTPNLFSDVDGRYRGMDKQIHTAVGYNRYTVFSLWDTFRAFHPLMNQLEPERTRDWIVTFLEMYKERGELPVWELAGNETYCMIGYHSVPVVVSAYLDGIRDFDTDLALRAMIDAATGPQAEKMAYDSLGYVPGDRFSESVSKTLEFAYDDYCIATFAKALGRDDVYKTFIKRAQNWKNVYDPITKFMRPRRNGGFPEPFDPYQVDFNYTEANSWQYSLFVPHDITTLRRYMGGKDSLQVWLNDLFFNSTENTGREQADITGLIGQYAQGNEPSHHVAFLYEIIQSQDTVYSVPDVITEIIDRYYTNEPDGLCGNEDCGQMSAWLIWALRKQYPLNIHCSIRAHSGRFGYENEAAIGQYSNILSELITPVPIIMGPQTSFTEKSTISVFNAEPGTRTKVKLIEEGNPEKTFIYTEPFSISSTCEITAWSEKESYSKSKISTAKFVKRSDNRKVVSISGYDQQYSAGGDVAVIDGMRGGNDFRTQHWQGFQGKDVEVVLDLGISNEVSHLGISCYQEIKPWIWMPSQVTFFGSRDGFNFRPLGTAKSDLEITDTNVFIREISIDIAPEKMRYVKIIAKPVFAEIPKWHLGSGGKPWIFIDEVIVR